MSIYVAVGLIWGSEWIPYAEVSRTVPPLRAGALRFFVAAISAGLAALVLRLRSGSPAKVVANFRTSLVLGLVMLAGPYALTALSTGRVNARLVPTLFALIPLAALLIGKDRRNAAIPPLVIGAGGVAVLVAPGFSLSLDQFAGAILVAFAVALGAFALVYAQRHLPATGLPGSIAIQCLVAAIALAALSGLVEHGSPALLDPALLSLLALGAGTGLGLLLMYRILHKLAPWQVGALQWTATLFAVAESAWLLRARPPVEMWVGTALVIGATIWLLCSNSDHLDVVTLQITSYTSDSPAASESEVRSK